MAQNNDQILAYLDDNQSLSQKQEKKVGKYFEVARSHLSEYDVLGVGQNTDFNLRPSPHEPVEAGRGPLIPMMISVVPPDVYPSGQSTTKEVPAPSEINIRLTDTDVEGEDDDLVGSEVAPTDMVVTPTAVHAKRADQSVSLNASFRTAANREVNGPPVNWTSTNENLATVDDSGEVTVQDPSEGAATIIARTTLSNGETIEKEIVISNSEQAVDQITSNDDELAPSPERDPSQQGGPAETTTEVSTGTQYDSGQYLNNLTERYTTFRDKAKQADRDLEEHNQTIRHDREPVRDEIQQQNEEIRDARIQGENSTYLKRQVEAIKDLPPLIMYVNPSEFSVSYEHVISDGNRGREGYIIEHWGLQQPRISASGTIGATMINASNDLNRPTGGLTRMLRRGSAAFQHFMNLFQIYKNNAYIYNTEDRISLVGAVKIFYDDTIYTGSFDSLSMSESEDTPFDLEYDFEFTVRFEDTIDLPTSRQQ